MLYQAHIDRLVKWDGHEEAGTDIIPTHAGPVGNRVAGLGKVRERLLRRHEVTFE